LLPSEKSKYLFAEEDLINMKKITLLSINIMKEHINRFAQLLAQHKYIRKNYVQGLPFNMTEEDYKPILQDMYKISINRDEVLKEVYQKLGITEKDYEKHHQERYLKKQRFIPKTYQLH